ncbi:MAG TPA: heterodisulfide reductase-related iron-sulfur binding cluster, partial [Roseiflexaceae bacterium]|nr:heterodisulfide reductase-related iron-sulfur binding cluster [Roseiflexaceae bacterium]
MTETFREIYWNVGETLGSLTVYLSALLALAVLTWGVLRDVSRWRRGRPDARIDRLGARLAEALSQVFGQKKVLKDRRPGTMHALVFFGFLALFIGTDIIAVEEDFTIPLFGADAGKILVGEFYKTYELVLDFMGLVFLTGLIWMALRRYGTRPDRLHNRRTDAWALAVLIYITISGYLIEGLRIANQTIGGVAVYTQEWASRAFVGYGLATVFRAIGLGESGGEMNGIANGLHLFFWFSHALLSFAFIASIPFAKLQHMFYTPLNTFFRDTGPKGALNPIPQLEAEIERDEPQLGVATLADFTWKQRLDFDSCMSCGRCQSKCPAYASGSELSPKFLITKMANLMRGEPITMRDGTLLRVAQSIDPNPLAALSRGGNGAGVQLIEGHAETIPLVAEGLFSENELWSCTTCRACVEECPAMIEHVDMIVDLRRNLTMIQSEVPSGVKRVLEGIERTGNPWRLPARDRTAWAAGLGVPTLAERGHVDVLYWVGCAPSYDERSRRVARSMVELMQRAGIDFAILGDEETCTGDPARRMGEELLFQQQAQTNIETMNQYTFKRVVTTCAHCFNTIRNEYPQLGGRAGVDYEVIHHTQLLAELVASGKLTPSEPVNEKVAYHDPCYIGRYNDVYDEPRDMLRAIPGLELVEAPELNRERAMCCGGGGGNVWNE